MFHIVLFGPPGAGKGTQAVKIAEHFQLKHVSTGDLLRAEIKAETELGMYAKSFMDKGFLVPDDVVIQMIGNQLNTLGTYKGIVFDGFPRTTEQATALDNLLTTLNQKINVVLSLEVDDEELIKRLVARGKQSGRADDQDESTVRNRLNVYGNQTAPLKAFYIAQEKLKPVNGIGDISTITNSLIEAC